MVVTAYPLAKIGLLLLKQLSKPVANFIKNEAKKHPQIRKHVIVPTGKAFSWAESKVVKSVKGSKAVEKAEVTEEEAVEIGANALGEIVLFGILCFLLILEYNRQSDKKAVIERIKADEVLNIQEIILDVIDDVEKLKKSVRAIELDLAATADVIAREERSHTPVHDHNFWDIMNKTTKPEDEPNIESR